MAQKSTLAGLPQPLALYKAAVVYTLLPCSGFVGLCPFLEVGTSAHCFQGRLELLPVYH